MWVQSLAWEDPLEECQPLRYSGYIFTDKLIKGHYCTLVSDNRKC